MRQLRANQRRKDVAGQFFRQLRVLAARIKLVQVFSVLENFEVVLQCDLRLLKDLIYLSDAAKRLDKLFDPSALCLLTLIIQWIPILLTRDLDHLIILIVPYHQVVVIECLQALKEIMA